MCLYTEFQLLCIKFVFNSSQYICFSCNANIHIIGARDSIFVSTLRWRQLSQVKPESCYSGTSYFIIKVTEARKFDNHDIVDKDRSRAWPAAIQTCIVIDRSSGKFRTGWWPVANTVCSMFDRPTNKVSGWKDRYRLKRKKKKKKVISFFEPFRYCRFLSLERDKFALDRTIASNRHTCRRVK